MMVESSGDLVGRVVAGKYAVLSVIGQGAMGVVYRARQVALDKVVALKVLSTDLRDDPEFVLRFHTEARAASRLDHPNSTRVLDFGEEPDGLLYIAMELLEGRTLADVLDEEFPLSVARIASILSQTLSAVGAAHALGVLHRDLKPENIVVLEARDDEDRRIDVVKVCDFGIAKLEGAVEPSHGDAHAGLRALARAASALPKATSVGVIVGTPQYMSPEQTRGEKLDVRSDLYSLGVVLFEMLTRRPPFEGDPADVLYQHTFDAPPKPSALQPNVDRRLEAICLRALEKDRKARYGAAREMRLALRPLLDNPALHHSQPRVVALSSATPIGGITPTLSGTVAARSSRRGRVMWIALPAMALAMTGAVVVHRVTRPPIARVMAPVQPTAPQPDIASASATASLIESSAPPSPIAVAPTADVVQRVRRTGHVQHKATEVTQTRPDPTVVEVASSAPPPALAATPTAATPPVTSSAPPAVTTDPSRAHVDLGPIRADRVGPRSVETAMRHVDFTQCYRTAVAQRREPDGTATLSLEMDEERVTHAELVGGAFSAGLRQCVSQRALGLRVTNADTGSASAKVTLRFALQ